MREGTLSMREEMQVKVAQLKKMMIETEIINQEEDIKLEGA